MRPFLTPIGTLTLVLLFLGCESPPAEVAPLRPVETTEVGYNSEDRNRTFSGTARTDTIVNLSFRSTGILSALNIKLGQAVHKGQMLAELDNVQARLAQEQAITSLNSAESQLNTTKLSLDRVRTLYEKGSASLSDFENAKNSYRTALASYESAQRSVQIQKEQIRDGYLYAPEAGTIASVEVELDENISAGQVIAVLNAGSSMEIAVGIPESVINLVEVGALARVSFPSLPNSQHQGTVSEVAPSLSNQTGTYPVKVAVDSAAPEIRSGMTANVTFDFSKGTSGETLVVPAKAVGEDSQGRFVFLVESVSDAEAIVSKTYIQIGELSSSGFEVLDGLTAGQSIATAGLQTLLDGQHVQIGR